MEISGIFLTGVLTVVAAAIGTVTGFGTSTIMVPALLLFFPLPQTLLLVGIIHSFNDVWKAVLFRGGIRWRLIILFGVPGVVASFLGARLVVAVDETILSRLLGGFLTAYVVFLFLNPSFALRQSVAVAAGGGSISGFLAGLFGVGGAVRSAALSSFNLPRDVFIAVNGAISLFVDLTRVGTYFAEGMRLVPGMAAGLFLFIPASFAGAYIARMIVVRIPQDRFRLVVAVFLFVVGAKFLVFP